MPDATVRTVDDIGLFDLLGVVGREWRLVLGSAVVVGAVAFGASFLLTPQFTAKTTFIPPQGNSGGGLSAALSALGPLASLAGLGGGVGSGGGEMYVALLQSQTLANRMIDRFKLQDLYKARFVFEAREELKNRTRATFSKREGFIELEVDDTDPQRAAQMANQYVDELRRMTAGMALTDAQRRRAFFEKQLNETKGSLINAQNALQASGFNQGALRSEPQAAAEEYARIKAELTTTEVKLHTLRSGLTDQSPEITQLEAAASALRRQLRTLEQKSDPASNQDYVGKYREFKYQETLFEQLAKQFEAARLDESQDGTAIQVVDPALVPEWKSKPKRAAIGLAATLIAAVVMSAFLIGRYVRRLSKAMPPAPS